MNALFRGDTTREGFAAFNMVDLLIHKPVKFHNKTCRSRPTSGHGLHRLERGPVWASGQGCSY